LGRWQTIGIGLGPLFILAVYFAVVFILMYFRFRQVNQN
jgi:hypothetical protein